jgi:diacylglycerol kinase family enzyme
MTKAATDTKAHSPQTSFRRCVILYNPASTRAAQGERSIEELRTLFPKELCTVLSTSAKGRKANANLLFKHADKLGKHTLLVVIAGDGTVNMAVDALMHDPRSTESLRQTVILPLWGGNANDLAHMLNGSPRRMPLHDLLTKGQVVAVHPLRCELTNEDGAQVRTAICYASFGASAYAAQALESLRGKKYKHPFESLKFIYELGMVVRAMIRAPRFKIASGDDEPHSVYDHVFMNGPRFAKVQGVSLKLTDKAFYHAEVERKRLSTIALHIMELTQKRAAKKVARTDAVSFVLRDATWAQVDGEIMYLRAGTSVRTFRSPMPFYALSTMHRAAPVRLKMLGLQQR